MKYRDKGSLKFQEKQRDREEGYSFKSDRQVRRENEHRLSIFYFKCLSKNIDKFWWNNLKETDKEKIMSLHSLQQEAISSDKDCWYSDPVFDTWGEWYDYIKTTFKTNKIKLREDKLKIIGI
jgi:hypothetical protein